MTKKVAIVGYGIVGQAYHKMFPDAVLYDPFSDKRYGVGNNTLNLRLVRDTTQQEVNKCDIAIVSVWTGLNDKDELDTSIIEEVVGWIECPLIIIKSALQPGTVDRLVKKTGKRIAVSVEYIGEGDYPVHFWKYPHQSDPRLHQMLVVGGAKDVATEAAEILWSKLSPDVSIHILTALEAETVKLIENFYGALKVTFINSFLSLAQKSDTNFIQMHQAWQSDPRTDSMHLRAVSHNRGWVSRCWSKDVPALATYAKLIGADDMVDLVNTILRINSSHLNLNEDEKDTAK